MPITHVFTAKVVGITDGDIIKVINDGPQVKVRLHGVNTPEKKQTYGQKAEKFTVDMVAGQDVERKLIKTAMAEASGRVGLTCCT